MGDFLGKFFVDPKALPDGLFGDVQVVFLGIVYASILYNASCEITEGSELLLLIPSMAALVGPVVLPILGAVPDAAIVLFSALGPDAEEQLVVGVGALAGSTIMLLTVPWFMSVVGGRVNYENGRLTYRKPKLVPPGYCSLDKTGVAGSSYVAGSGRLMICTALAYLVIQAPLLFSKGAKFSALTERWFALAGMVYCIVGFVVYLAYQYNQSLKGQAQQVDFCSNEMRKRAIQDKTLSLRGAMRALLKLHQDSGRCPPGYLSDPLANPGDGAVSGEKGSGRLTLPLMAQRLPNKAKQQMRELVRPFFLTLDRDNNGKLDKEELRNLLLLLNEKPTELEMQKLFDHIDADASGFVEFEEFTNCLIYFVLTRPETYAGTELTPMSPGTDQSRRHSDSEAAFQADDKEQEDEEIPEDLAGLPADEQQRRIKLRAFKKMLWGTLLVLLFSDPMVDILSDVGRRTGIPAFYVSFVLAPLASNASEILASYSYSLKKTQQSITISFSALLGAASMNNTFCLGVFVGIVFFRSLMWTFTAETISILIVQFAMGLLSQKKIHLVGDGLLVLCLYPLALVVVFCLQNLFQIS